MRKFWRNKFPRLVIYMSAFVLIFNASFVGALFNFEDKIALVPFLEAPIASADEGDDLCQVPVDVVLIMDKSGSMADGYEPAKCEWWNMEQVGPSFQFVLHCDDGNTDSGDGCDSQELTSGEVTQSWCEGKYLSPSRTSTYYPVEESKMYHAKAAANSFVDNLGPGDQSAVVAFSTIASLEKTLSNDHATTKSTIDGLTTDGSTNIGDAIDQANQELSSVRSNSKATKTIILLTDGIANEPNHIQDPEAYAEEKAAEAAALGYKIFTIGLGSNGDINEAMLQNIASMTNATFHHSENGDDLSSIYNDISYEVCQYGSISGCKWSDADGDGEVGAEEDMLPNWTIQLSGDMEAEQLTDATGCYLFSGLAPGDYVVSEVVQDGWTQTYPDDETYDVSIIEYDEHFTDVDFGNFNTEDSCQLINEQGTCTADGLREYSYTEHDLCEDSYTEEDETCSCVSSEDSRECNSDDQADVTYTYNYEYCGETYTETVEDLSCNSDYQCTDWTDVECVDNGTMSQIQECTDQYSASFTDTRDIADVVCDCESSELSRECTGENQANVTYSYNYSYCDHNYTVPETDETCGGGGGPTLPICGDSIQESGEQCDDGNLNNGDGCNSSCQTESTPNPVCGDGNLDAGEGCDDSNNDDGDGCSATCTIEPFCGDGNLDAGEECDDSNTDDGDGCSAVCELEGIQPGDVVINEIMQNPGVSSDSKGEWFEIYNTADEQFDLQNCSIGDLDGNFHTISSSLVIDPQGYLVLGINSDTALNGGVTLDYKYSTFVLGNSDDEVLLSCDNTEIDRVIYDGGPTFPDPSGASMILADPSLDNNDGVNWCVSTSPYGKGDLGTPGEANDPCAGFTGGIEIYKYLDLDGDMSTIEDQLLLPPITWTFTAEHNQSSIQVDTDQGIAYFPDLEPAEYIISEKVLDGWYLLGTNTGTTTVSVLPNSTSTINFYNAEYASISGYKFEDLDGVTSTVSDLIGLPDWTINLFTLEGTEPISSTTTDEFGFYEFTNLITGDYRLEEVLQEGWVQLSAPDPITLLSGDGPDYNHFINYFEGGSGGDPDPDPDPDPEPEPSPPSGGGGGGGGGLFTARPSVSLEAQYPFEKELSTEVPESLVVSNDGNIILTNGQFTIDLDQDKLKLTSAIPAWDSLDETTQIATWTLDTLAVGGEYLINFSVMPLAEGSADTEVIIIFDQASSTILFTENINPASVNAGGSQGTGGGDEDFGTGGGPVDGAGGSGSGGTGGTGGGTGGEAGGETGGETGEGTGGEGSAEGETEENGIVEGAATEDECADCPWWVWLIAVILQLWTLVVYSYMVKKPVPVDDGQTEAFPDVKAPIIWWVLVGASLIATYFLFIKTCDFPALVLALPFIFYFAVLVIHHYITTKNQKGLWPFIPLLIAIGPIAVYLFATSWVWWIWVLVIGLYILSTISYYSSINKDSSSSSWWYSIVLLTLLLIVQEIAIALHLIC